MKAIEMLESLNTCGINSEDWGIASMHENFPFKNHFGGSPIHKVTAGRYVYVNAAHISDKAFECLDNCADHVIFGDDPEEQCTMLFRIEDEV